MKLLTDWGFTREGWRNGQRGEHWVLAQALLILGFILLPVYPPVDLSTLPPTNLYLAWAASALCGLGALIFFGKGLLDLGRSLTPLPYPREDGQLVQSGVYGLVRHPVYTGVILVALSWAAFYVSLSHFIGAFVLFAFFNAKASREEAWLVERYPDYDSYRQHVKKLIPWIY